MDYNQPELTLEIKKFLLEVYRKEPRSYLQILGVALIGNIVLDLFMPLALIMTFFFFLFFNYIFYYRINLRICKRMKSIHVHVAPSKISITKNYFSIPYPLARSKDFITIDYSAFKKIRILKNGIALYFHTPLIMHGYSPNLSEILYLPKRIFTETQFSEFVSQIKQNQP